MFFVGLGAGRFELFVHPFAWGFFCAAEHAAVSDAKFFGELGVGFKAQHDAVEFPHHTQAHIPCSIICRGGDEARVMAPTFCRAIGKVGSLDCRHIRGHEVVAEVGVQLGADEVVEGLPAFEEEEANAGFDVLSFDLGEGVAGDINDVRIDGTFGFEGPWIGHDGLPKVEFIHTFKELI